MCSINRTLISRNDNNNIHCRYELQFYEEVMAMNKSRKSERNKEGNSLTLTHSVILLALWETPTKNLKYLFFKDIIFN